MSTARAPLVRRATRAGLRRADALAEDRHHAVVDPRYDDDRVATVEQRADLSNLVDCLSARERAVVRLRFERDLTQSEIADVLGLSQLRVSRILREAIERLRRLAARPLHV